MHKFFTDKTNIFENEALIKGDDVKHIYKVLRLSCGTQVILNNYDGEEYLSEISYIDKSEVRLNILKKLDTNNESPLKVTLFQGLPKSAKMDLIVQKGTELGINEIIPVITERVDVKLKGEFKKLDRLQKIANEACKQSKRTIVPKVSQPVEFGYILDNIKSFDLVIVPYENEEGTGIKYIASKYKELKNVAIVIGPEGGFEPSEIDSLKEKGAEIVTLGKRILRTETAGFTACALLQYEYGDLGGTI